MFRVAALVLLIALGADARNRGGGKLRSSKGPVFAAATTHDINPFNFFSSSGEVAKPAKKEEKDTPAPADKKVNQSQAVQAENDDSDDADDEDLGEDSDVEASWSPTVAMVEQSLKATESKRQNMTERLQWLRKTCDGPECSLRLEEVAGSLRRLTIAVAQLRQMKHDGAKKLEDAAQEKAIRVAKLEQAVADQLALQQFAFLSKEDVDMQRYKLGNLSQGYTKKIEEAEEAITKADDKLAAARDKEREADKAALKFVANAKGISAAVNSTDGFVKEEVMEASRKEHTAAALFHRAQDMAKNAASMLRYHRARAVKAEDLKKDKEEREVEEAAEKMSDKAKDDGRSEKKDEKGKGESDGKASDDEDNEESNESDGSDE